MKVITRICLIVSLVIIVPFSSALAQPKVVTCKGKYVMGDLDTKKNARELALMDAKRLALEEAGTYLESSSEVKNFELTKDEVTSLASGVISVKILEESWNMSGENLVVTVLIRATVDTSNLEDRVASLKESKENVEEFKNIQSQLAALQAEIKKLKEGRTADKGGSMDRGRATDKDSEKNYAALTNRVTALDHLRNAESAMISGRITEAIDIYSKIMDIEPTMAEAYRGKAVAYTRIGQAQEGLALIEKAIEIAPDDARSYGARSFIMGSMGNFDQALKSVSRAIKIEPKNPKFYFGRANINMKLRKPQDAIKDFKRSCKLGNQNACRIANEISKRMKRRQ
ncbi:MAG: tetratricopeptide repeat protein [Syntrophaceae bacterium]|nr:tetratricopeptide repeat protein [Syntrophaceae bacterium]